MNTLTDILSVFNLIPNLFKTLLSFIPRPFSSILLFWFVVIIGVVIFKFARGDS